MQIHYTLTKMKGIKLFFCASPASTAICVSMDQWPMVCHGGRAIDRHNPHLRDGLRSKALTPSSFQPPTKSKPYHQKGRKRTAKKTDIISPSGSSRHLLNDTPSFVILSDFDPDESLALKPPSTTRSHDQVVVLRVSLHCKGCEGKVRKHISRMEGVASFSIDFAMKKVTIIGDVTPSGVLASMSKVKNAQLWPPSSSSSSSSSVGSSDRQTKE